MVGFVFRRSGKYRGKLLLKNLDPSADERKKLEEQLRNATVILKDSVAGLKEGLLKVLRTNLRERPTMASLGFPDETALMRAHR